MTRWATLLALLAAPCGQEASKPAPPAEAVAAESCLDRQLREKGLNPFGDPPDMMYAGGSPLFNEKTGESIPREQYVYSRHPDIARACGADAGR